MNKLKIFMAVAALSVTVSANALAKEVSENRDSLGKESSTKKIAVETKLDKETEVVQKVEVSAEPEVKHYTVEPGDTLSDIAVDHQVSVEKIKEENSLSSDVIQPGLEIEISEVADSAEAGELSNKTEVQEAENHTEYAAIETTETPQPDTESTQVEEESKELTVTATAYTATCEGCSGITATGVNILENPDQKVIAVDPSVIPLGSKVYVEGYGYATAADTGGAIKGNKIDVFIPEQQDALNWGKKQVEVKIIN
ncbi:3D domain-containing protein [Neobacillus sp. K501]